MNFKTTIDVSVRWGWLNWGEFQWFQWISSISKRLEKLEDLTKVLKTIFSCKSYHVITDLICILQKCQSLKRKKIFQKEKRHSSVCRKTFQISRKIFLSHIHFNSVLILFHIKRLVKRSTLKDFTFHYLKWLWWQANQWLRVIIIFW